MGSLARIFHLSLWPRNKVVLGAPFSPDGTRIVTASADKTARIWKILPLATGPAPEWFRDFLRYMAQMRLNSEGELEQLKSDDWLGLRERLRAVRHASAGRTRLSPHSPPLCARAG